MKMKKAIASPVIKKFRVWFSNPLCKPQNAIEINVASLLVHYKNTEPWSQSADSQIVSKFTYSSTFISPRATLPTFAFGFLTGGPGEKGLIVRFGSLKLNTSPFTLGGTGDLASSTFSSNPHNCSLASARFLILGSSESTPDFLLFLFNLLNIRGCLSSTCGRFFLGENKLFL